jgi:transposase-like protein
LDGSHFKYHAGAKAEPLLAAWGITTGAKPAFVGLAPAANEGNDAWDGFLGDLKSRRLACPLLVISDGAAGLVGAIERAFPQALRQRCLVHRARNILAKVPKHAQAELKAAYWAVFDVPEDVAPGPETVGLVQRRINAFATKYQKLFPAAVACLLDDRAALTSYLRFPREHWQRVRHSNFIVIWSREEGVYDVDDRRLGHPLSLVAGAELAPAGLGRDLGVRVVSHPSSFPGRVDQVGDGVGSHVGSAFPRPLAQ